MDSQLDSKLIIYCRVSLLQRLKHFDFFGWRKDPHEYKVKKTRIKN
jgi:hypothetical protein